MREHKQHSEVEDAYVHLSSQYNQYLDPTALLIRLSWINQDQKTKAVQKVQILLTFFFLNRKPVPIFCFFFFPHFISIFKEMGNQQLKT